MTQDRSEMDRDAAANREADLKAAAASLSAKRTAEDERIAQRRLAEDEARADKRLAEDRVAASTLNRVNVASAAMQAASDNGDIAAVRAANAELQAAVRDHLSAMPEQLPAGGVHDIDELVTRYQLAVELAAQGKHAEAEAEYRDLLTASRNRAEPADVQPS
jgi:hypothetical protein